MTNPLSTIEHTRLTADTTPEGVRELCQQAQQHGFAGVCVNPVYVVQAAAELRGTPVRVVTVVNFPLGAGSARGDVCEAEQAVTSGAHEVDWVVPIGLALDARWEQVQARVAAVRRAIGDAVLKVIVECGYFEPPMLRQLAESVLGGGADYLKTSTGMGPRGASVVDVALLAEVAGSRARVKASGGIRSLADVRALLDAGASRIGTSQGVAIAGEMMSGGG